MCWEWDYYDEEESRLIEFTPPIDPSKRFVMVTDDPYFDELLGRSVDPEETVPDRFLHLLDAPRRELMGHHRVEVAPLLEQPVVTVRTLLRYSRREIRRRFGRNPRMDEFAEPLAA